jgi:hypothetical protein
MKIESFFSCIKVMSGLVAELFDQSLDEDAQTRVFKTYHETLIRNLVEVVPLAAERNICILLEGINRTDMPGYFLSRVGQAAEVVLTVRKVRSSYPANQTIPYYPIRIWLCHVDVVMNHLHSMSKTFLVFFGTGT